MDRWKGFAVMVVGYMPFQLSKPFGKCDLLFFTQNLIGERQHVMLVQRLQNCIANVVTKWLRQIEPGNFRACDTTDPSKVQQPRR